MIHVKHESHVCCNKDLFKSFMSNIWKSKSFMSNIWKSKSFMSNIWKSKSFMSNIWKSLESRRNESHHTCEGGMLHKDTHTYTRTLTNTSTHFQEGQPTRSQSPSLVGHDSIIVVTWLMCMFELSHVYVWHDSYVNMTWVMCMCDMTHMFTCDMIHVYVWHDSCVCVA